MNRRENSPEDILDLLVDDIRNEPIDTAIVEESSRRVWERMSLQTPRSNRLSTCPDFQALMPAYRDGSLAAGRRMLLEDHTRACANCRKQLYGEIAEPAAKVVEMPVRRMTRGKWMAIAASGTIALVFGNFLYEQFAPARAEAAPSCKLRTEAYTDCKTETSCRCLREPNWVTASSSAPPRAREQSSS
jgi:hypothetical protein